MKNFYVGLVVGLWMLLSMKTVQTAENEPLSSTDESNSQLAKRRQNPISRLASVPFRFNFNLNTGPYAQTETYSTIEPQIPFALNKDWDLISRSILTVADEPTFMSNTSHFGLGGITTGFFLVPTQPSKLIWGFGPTFGLPITTDKILGTGKFTIGPNAVVVVMDRHWVYGVLVDNQFSFAGDTNRTPVNQMVIQPFVNYNFQGGWFLTSAPNIISDWQKRDSNRWVIPIGGGGGRVFEWGNQKFNVQLEGYYNVVKPKFGADWQLHLEFVLMFPE